MSINSSLDSVLDRLILRLKPQRTLEQIRFIRSGRSSPAEKPVRGYIASCGIEKAKLCSEVFQGFSEGESNLSLCEGTLSIQLVAPQNSEGRDLGALSFKLMSALCRADAEGVLTDTELSKVYYDRDLMTLCRDITARVKFTYEEEAE
ncbi:MAG: hypothetical protein ACI4GZ_03130 [Ruminococcus sp.]